MTDPAKPDPDALSRLAGRFVDSLCGRPDYPCPCEACEARRELKRLEAKP